MSDSPARRIYQFIELDEEKFSITRPDSVMPWDLWVYMLTFRSFGIIFRVSCDNTHAREKIDDLPD